ncbi:Lead, cadmium, zinc and mercury transporting ATPase Copper-translocating P-type ATPase [Desulfurella amilsii]|uniref:Lead, cadmium, zinc and mercury transporting ATPase Copper-translocating P-type ATPase n=1 Tax=Desulfurella amilsii TaxID=1562698 RepID=A0A1X4XVC5_9BACT|nr:cation-transporting P-type ATPase [Desulfurella amilsii]OSS41475.1 Lead, cadmium, zinc and mercury transporting ATPase Copper-translocating P-type ATPase [Desulfurella amilsii]
MTQKNNQGLTTNEAQKRLLEFGPNQIFKPTKISFLGIAKHEVMEPMILLLLVVGFFYSIWGKLEDAITIFVIISLLVLAEVYNEFRAKKAIASLEKITAPKTKVLRDSNIIEIDSENVVPDDILILTSGTKIAADAKVDHDVSLQVDESALTGESFPLDKNYNDEIYAGTIVVSGEGRAEVFATAENTKLGKIASTLKEVKPPKTALQLAMKSLAGKLVYLAVFFSILIPIIGIMRGQDLKTMVLTGLSLSFATIPEELPIIITMVLGLGAYELSKNNFLVKRIKAAETLGNATVIVTDKTGTITESQMKIASLYPGNEKEIIEKAFCAISQYSVSPMELEIKNKAVELKIDKSLPEMIRERIFGNGRKSKSVIRKNENEYELFTSGAPEEIFTMCRDIGDDIKNGLAEQTSKGRRVIAVAYKKLTAAEKNLDFAELEKDLNFAGLISFEDPPRKGVKETIAKAVEAGIRTIMVTGDHPLTARSIAKEIGILAEDNQVLTGKDLDKLSEEELQNIIKSASVFARTTPHHKYRIVQALQKNGEVVAVTGDGINDALALKGADIGIAMGIRGTDVAKEAAEVVLADDNYITIMQGIFEGRKFFDNLQKGIKYYLSVKVALILIFLLPVLLGIPMPLAPIQIIILELFMDLAASAGFVAEPKERNIYSRPPRNPKESIINNRVIKDILIKGTVLFIAVISVYFYARSQNLSLVQSQTFAFSAWIFGHIVLAFISRSDKESIFSLGMFTNKIINLWALTAITFLVLGIYLPFLKERFNLFSISFTQLIFIALIVSLIVGSLELRKMFNLNKR